MTNEEAYIQGFSKAAEDYGINPQALYKVAELMEKDALLLHDLARTGSAYIKNPQKAWQQTKQNWSNDWNSIKRIGRGVQNAWNGIKSDANTMMNGLKQTNLYNKGIKPLAQGAQQAGQSAWSGMKQVAKATTAPNGLYRPLGMSNGNLQSSLSKMRQRANANPRIKAQLEFARNNPLFR